jgi:hypothetical protein
MKKTSLALKCAITSLALTGILGLAHGQTTIKVGPEVAGAWTPLTHTAPETIGYALLLSDGTVMAQGYANNTWYRLSPDSKGKYVNGTWTKLASMHDTRLYFFAQMVKDGRVILGGGEYGSGGPKSEYYNPLTDVWTSILSPGINWIDGNSEVLPNGNVMTAPVGGEPGTLVFDLLTSSWITGAPCIGGQDEAAWVKLPDQSILTIDPFGTQTERYIPSLNQWIRDTPCPVGLYGYGGELGGGYLLPNGKVIIFGATNNTAIYTPSGTTQPGTWQVGPLIPNGLGQVDAPGAMMPNGKILLAVGTTSGFGSVSYWYEYDYLTNNFTLVPSPGGGMSYGAPEFIQTLVNLPDGTILQTGISNQLYVYTPFGPQVASGKPAVKYMLPNPDGSYHVVGTLFNGISEGAAYGDDWQTNTNFPIAKLTDAKGNAYYARTYNWSSTGVMTGSTQVSTDMSLPRNLPRGQYSLSIIANGISSDPTPFFDGFAPNNIFLNAGYNGHGTVSDVVKVDGLYYTGTSVEASGSQIVNVEADFTLPTGVVPPSLSVICSASAVKGASGLAFLYDWTTGQWVYLNQATPLGIAQTSVVASSTGSASRFIGPNGAVRAIFKAVVPDHQSPAPFTLRMDQFILG